MTAPFRTDAPSSAIFADEVPGINLQSLASELASGLDPTAEVWRRYGCDRAMAEKVVALPVFRQMLAEARSRWSSDDNVSERIRKKAQLAIEQGLADVFSDCVNPKLPLNHRVQGFQLISKWAGMDTPGVGAGGAGGVSIRIDLSGSDGRGGVIDVTPSGAGAGVGVGVDVSAGDMLDAE